MEKTKYAVSQVMIGYCYFTLLDYCSTTKGGSKNRNPRNPPKFTKSSV